ncbi:efflux RND transporter periplasmic adaptor subunit [Gemmatimonas groenlandica]|uniref:Efflux RND transporter periplasmic adaptor subunit n=1 Tax=Gemmatimonas groenlandica TaxID=2732249 RepID=A0A6M4IU68_9BACT|nr:efflux RND transporter periplasmic adaptor subunit [Gemmatimonas groenlandica]QJR37036.1 efflux RND transporter periplasmic adaptor subunit [Gemmatimonas groenlandica]
MPNPSTPTIMTKAINNPRTTHMLRPTMLLSAAMVPLLAACDSAPAAEQDAAARAPAVSVSVATVTSATPANAVSATGTFGSRDEIPLAFKIGGVVSRVLIDEGATVQRGQLLASLDLREINAAVDKAQVGFDKAQRDQARVQRLAADSVATLAQLQDATSALEAARSDLVSAKVNREYATIVAPEGGIVLRSLVTAGSNVSAGTPILQLGGSRRGRVLRVGLPDRDALRVQLGDAATVHFDALPSRTFTGRVQLVGRSADPRTGTYAVEITVNGADALPSGLVGAVSIAARASTDAATRGASISVDALLEADRDAATVYTVAAAREAPGELIAQPQRVRVMGVRGDRATIEGLAPDTRIVTRGAPYVTPGARVRIVTADTLNAALKATASPATPVKRTAVLP